MAVPQPLGGAEGGGSRAPPRTKLAARQRSRPVPSARAEPGSGTAGGAARLGVLPPRCHPPPAPSRHPDLSLAPSPPFPPERRQLPRERGHRWPRRTGSPFGRPTPTPNPIPRPDPNPTLGVRDGGARRGKQHIPERPDGAPHRAAPRGGTAATGTRERLPARAPRRGAPPVPVRSCGFKSGRSGAMCSAPNKSNNKGGRRTPPPPPGAGAAGSPGGGPRPRPAPAPPRPARTCTDGLGRRSGAAAAPPPPPSRRSLFADAGPGPAPPSPPARRRPSPPSLPPASRRAGPLPAAAVSGASLFSAARSGRGGPGCAGGACPFKKQREAPDRVPAPGGTGGARGGDRGGTGGGGVARCARVPRDQACHGPQPSWSAGPPRGAPTPAREHRAGPGTGGAGHPPPSSSGPLPLPAASPRRDRP